MMSTERLNQSSDRIREGRKLMLETEELGVSILQDLHQQRQSLLHAHDTVCLTVHHLSLICNCSFGQLTLVKLLAPRTLKYKDKMIKRLLFDSQLHGVDDNISRSKKILSTMSRRMNRNKWIIGSIIAVLVLAIILIIYFKLSH